MRARSMHWKPLTSLCGVAFLVGCSADHGGRLERTDSGVDVVTVDAAAEVIVLDDTAVETPAPPGCAPIKTFTFTSTARATLKCDAANAVAVLDVAVPARGYAVGRATLKLRHVGASVSNVIHFWNARVEVGTAELAYGLGDDICPGSSATRENVGIGVLDAAKPRVRVMAYQGSSPCTDGALVVEPGSTVDVWVEDPACPRKDIAVASYYKTAGFSTYYEWTTSMTKLVSTSIATAGDEKLTVLGVVEGTPHNNPNSTCGSEAATLVMQTMVDGAIVTTSKEIVPASGGMGHLVLASEVDHPVKAGAHAVDLFVGSNFTSRVTTGGCCGDGTIVAIRRR